MSSRAEEEADPKRLRRVIEEEERGVKRRKDVGLDFRGGRDLTPLERLAAGFVEQEIRTGRLKPDQEIRMVAAYGEALALYHTHIEKEHGDGRNGSMVEVRDFMLPEDVLLEYVDGEPKQHPLRVVTVTFSPSE